MPDEFDLIAKYFAPLAGDEGLGLQDDAACLPARPGFDMIVSKDVLVEGTHFLKGASATGLAQKALGVNISDLAAKGAVPSAYFVGLVLPTDCSAEWIQAFAEGLALGQKRFGLSLAGGDTTTSNAAEAALFISITVVGYVPQGQMIQRAGASAGDDIYVTGTLGDAALGLLGLLGKLGDDPFPTDRYDLPQPRVSVGVALGGIASAAADVSDGLLADLGHICTVSGVGATVQQGLLPLSDAASAALKADEALHSYIYSGGDDYEIIFTAPTGKHQEIRDLSTEVCVPITKIGTVEKTKGIRLVDTEGKIVHTNCVGYQHFRQDNTR